tara:strand:+ start:155 stop:526 length:372 start_codon:yes stop_codon:yes gene_type:complete
MTQKNKLELLRIKYAIKDMCGLDGCTQRNDEQFKQMMERLEQLEEDSVKYRYTYEEQSVDIRTWTVESDRPLTDDEVEELCIEEGDVEGQVSHADTHSVEYHGTEYGDDSQRKVIQVKGGTND